MKGVKSMKKKVLFVVLLTVAIFIIGVSQLSAVVTTPVLRSSAAPLPAQTTKNYRITASIKGQKQGLISNNIRVLAVSHSVVSPRDAASGLPTGKRMHKPFVITKEVDKTSPQLMNVLCTNENLPEVVLSFSTGNPADTYTIKLTNANIAAVDLRQAKDSNGLTYEEIVFTYEKITWTYGNGYSAQDDWEINV
jgi:type VI secretion system secreted protein Hcp